MTGLLDGTVELHQGAAVLTLAGEIDRSSAPTLRALLQQATDLGTARVTVDLQDVGFLDASGVGVLVTVAQPAGPAAGHQ